MAAFLVHLTEVKKGIKPATLNQYVAAVAAWRAEQNLEPRVVTGFLKRTIDGYERELSEAGVAGVRQHAPREPITLAMLNAVHSVLRVDTAYEDSLFFAASVVGVYGFLRGGEFLVTERDARKAARRLLRVGHASISAAAVLLTIPISKTDQLAKGVVRRLPAQAGVVCPVKALSSYLELRRQKFGADSFKQDDPLFVNGEGQALTRPMYLNMLRNILTALGLDAEQVSRFTTHSLRRGGAQSLADAGAAVDDIKFQGRWKSGAYTAYLRPGSAAEARLSSAFSAAAAAASDCSAAAAQLSAAGFSAGSAQLRLTHPPLVRSCFLKC